MNIIKVLIPGAFRDAYAYMGKLCLMSRDRRLVVYDLDGLAARIEEKFAAAAPLPRFLFARNDWLDGAPLRALVENSSVRDALTRALEALARDLYEVPRSVLPVAQNDTGLNSRTLHDLRCYLTRMYVGADDGIYDFNVNWSDGSIDSLPRRRHDARCYSIGVGYGVVTASCGREGLFSAFGEYDYSTSRGQSALRRTAPRSVRAAWIGRNLLNYDDNASASLYSAKREQRKTAAPPGVGLGEQEDTVVTELENTHQDFSRLLTSEEVPSLSSDMVQYAFNSPEVVFVRTYDGVFHAWRWSSPRKNRPGRFIYRRNLEHSGERVLRAAVCAAGIVVETDDRVRLYAEGKWMTLFDRPVISVKTFLSSRRYRNLVAITAEEGVWLYSAVGLGPGRDKDDDRGSINQIVG